MIPDVQFINRPRPTFGEQIASGLQQGVQTGSKFAEQFLEHGLSQKSKNAEYARKLQGLENLKKSPYWEKASDLEKAILEREIVGDVSAQTSKSLINLQRESQGRNWTQARIDELRGGRTAPREDNNSVFGGQQRVDGLDQQLQELSLLATMPGPEGEFAKSEYQRLLKEKEVQNIPRQEYYKHAATQNAAFLDRISQIERDRPNTEFALAGIEDALGDAGKWSAFQDTIADRTGYEGARSAAGAELDSFIKNYFLGDLSSIKGGRPNVFIEKQLRDAYPKAGRDPVANAKTVVGMRMKEDINKAYVDRSRELEEFYVNKQGSLPSNFEAIVNKSLKDQVESIEKQAIDILHHMSSIEKQRDTIYRKYLKPGEILMMDSSGQPFAVPQKEESAYKEQGYFSLGKK